MPEIGQKSPNFNLPSTQNGSLGLSNFLGKSLIIFFYPKDDTKGCTVEAIDFSTHLDQFQAQNTTVIGVSKDTIEKHEKFIHKHGLTIPLLSDADGQMCEDFGVWKEKSMYGRQYMGIERTTFLINPIGEIQHIWHKVRVKGHVENVLETVRSL